MLLGTSFGHLAREAGLSGAQAVTMSVIVMAGASQFAAGPALARRFPARLLDVQLLTDQGVVLGYGEDGRVSASVYRAAGATVTVAWVVGTAAGAWGGNLLGDPARYGIDAAYPALFLALLGPQLRADGRARAAGALGVALTLLSYPFLPPGLPVVLATAGALAGWPRGRTR